MFHLGIFKEINNRGYSIWDFIKVSFFIILVFGCQEQMELCEYTDAHHDKWNALLDRELTEAELCNILARKIEYEKIQKIQY